MTGNEYQALAMRTNDGESISDWDIVTVWDLIDKTEREFDINLLQRVRRKK